MTFVSNYRSTLTTVTSILLAAYMWNDRALAVTPIAPDGQWIHMGFSVQFGTTPVSVDRVFFADPDLSVVIPAGFEGVVDVTDIGEYTTERYSLSVNGSSVGETSVPSYEILGFSMDDPNFGFANADWSSGTFTIGASEDTRTHTLLVNTTESGTLSSVWGAYIRVTLRAVGGGQSYGQWDDDAFTAATPEVDRAPDKNPDGDELNNGMEYLTGGNAEAVEPESPFTSQLDGENFIVTYRRRKAVPDGAEVVETSGTLGDDWGDNPNATITKESIDDDFEIVTVTIPTTGLPSLFWQVRLVE